MWSFRNIIFTIWYPKGDSNFFEGLVAKTIVSQDIGVLNTYDVFVKLFQLKKNLFPSSLAMLKLTSYIAIRRKIYIFREQSEHNKLFYITLISFMSKGVHDARQKNWVHVNTFIFIYFASQLFSFWFSPYHHLPCYLLIIINYTTFSNNTLDTPIINHFNWLIWNVIDIYFLEILHQ